MQAFYENQKIPCVTAPQNDLRQVEGLRLSKRIELLASGGSGAGFRLFLTASAESTSTKNGIFR